MMKKRLALLLILSMLLTSLTGCENKKATITTTVYPVKYLVQLLAGNKVDVEYVSSDDFIQRATLVKGYESILERTTLFIYIGGLEPYMDLYDSDIQKYSFDIINLASLSAINDFKRQKTTVTDTGVTVVTYSDYYIGPEFASVDTYDKDPFIWLDPIGMASMASTIKQWLQEKYPEDTLTFENNYKSLEATLVRLDAEFQTLKSIKNIKIATVTPTFGNWQSYGVEVYPLTISKYASLPSENQLKVIKQSITDNGVKYIAIDETLPQDLVDLYTSVKEELGLEEIRLSSLSKLSESDIDLNRDYMTIMYENLTAIESTFKGQDKNES